MLIRVGFLLASPAGAWLGGANYMRSLLGAIQALPAPRIAPVLFVSSKQAEGWREHFPGVPMVETALVDHWTLPWVTRKVLQLFTGKELLLDRLFRRNGVALFSHGGGLGPGARVKTLGWIPDFQHVHLPEFFSRETCLQRDRQFMKTCLESDAVIVSSGDVRKDLIAFCPEAASKVRVLRFVPQVPPGSSLPSREVLEARYEFTGPYFHLPNQFWKHKNHQVVVDALALLVAAGDPVQVMATGNTHDFRNPGYFQELMDQITQRGLGRAFRVLGMVPFEDMLGLMQHAVAVLNPSLFEGWSTTVEEAKCLGTRVILSDLPVHQEQAPPGGLFFPRQDPAALAEQMRTALAGGFPEPSAGRSSRAAYEAFALEYENIVVELLGGQ